MRHDIPDDLVERIEDIVDEYEIPRWKVERLIVDLFREKRKNRPRFREEAVEK